MKKLAVILTNRQAEALRMAAGLTLLDDKVDIYLLDKDLDIKKEPLVSTYLQMLNIIDSMGYYANFEKDGFVFLENSAIAIKLLDYDFVIPY